MRSHRRFSCLLLYTQAFDTISLFFIFLSFYMETLNPFSPRLHQHCVDAQRMSEKINAAWDQALSRFAVSAEKMQLNGIEQQFQ